MRVHTMSSRIRIVPRSIPMNQGWTYSGEQTSPKTITLSSGQEMTLFSDEQVHTATRKVLHTKLDAMTNKFLYGIDHTYARRIEQTHRFSQITITTKALEKAKMCARIAAQESPYELGMHLLREKNAPEDLVTDVEVAYRQQVTPSTCKHTPFFDFMYEGNREYAGWCHSHANFPVFHSADDNKNVGRIVTRGGLETTLEDSGAVVKIRYVPSLVVNIMDSVPFGAICIRYKDHTQARWKTNIKKVDVNVVQEEYPITIDKEKISSFIEREVEFG